jgi:hypothetical protein
MAGFKPESVAAVTPKIGKRFNPYDRFRHGIFIPESLCQYRGISHGAKVLWGRMKRYCGQNGEAYPSLAALAKEVAVSKDQARRYIRELQKRKFIEVDLDNKHYYHNGAGGTPHYYFLWHTCFEDAKDPPIADTPGVPLRTMPALTTGKSATQRESLNKRGNSDSRRPGAVQPLNIFDDDNFGLRPSYLEPLGWEQARELKRIERELPIEVIKENAKAELQPGSRRSKWLRILGERTLVGV